MVRPRPDHVTAPPLPQAPRVSPPVSVVPAAAQGLSQLAKACVQCGEAVRGAAGCALWWVTPHARLLLLFSRGAGLAPLQSCSHHTFIVT